ncbi:putative cyclin-dependent serine/threonine-protein kinase DDB_G0272797/DDB_G0274007 [Argiope bruennichi]|uniref:Uncharacterized protein n=1 Tax=Argiope bruennichi TaxID=94029 RepID=A0A8T0E8X5_ARGBR|nr:putative cyclin-dependent serine/threonine-protein kinase DDB_G0272797/DDB_G0274007 [Argiope bruennichi]KAF8767332.1 hypothetical protein HNY73_020312 [Argiope bruennichi]
MKISLVLLVGVIAVARAATARYEVGTERPGDFPATHPSVLESSSVSGIRDNKQGQFQHSQDLHVTGSPASNDFQRDSNLFLSQNLGTPASTTSATKSSVKGQFNDISSQHPQSFFNDKQNSPKQQQFIDGRQQNSGQVPFAYNDNQQSLNDQRFFNAEQQFPNQDQFLNDRQQQQQFYNDQHQQQQFFNDQQQQQFFDNRQQKSAQRQFFNEQQSPAQKQFYNDKQQSLNQQQQFYNDKQQSLNQQQQFYNDKQQSLNQQQQFYNDKQQALLQQQPRDQRETYNVQAAGISGQQLNGKRLDQEITSQKGQVKGDEPSIQIHSVSKGAVQLSAFDNRAQPVVLPQSAAMHSSSVVVSGLKNVPLLPAMVYNGGAVPMTHATVYSRDPLYKGGAGIRQHLQTPFVRYVYSHVL